MNRGGLGRIEEIPANFTNPKGLEKPWPNRDIPDLGHGVADPRDGWT